MSESGSGLVPFGDRVEAGRHLGEALGAYRNRDDVLVLALPRGGVPVGFELAEALRAPLDLIMVRKLGVPGHEELAMGAIASGGVQILNQEAVRALALKPQLVDQIALTEQRELARRERAYRGDRPVPAIAGRTVILADDGLATGSTMRAAIGAVRLRQAARVVVAVPVGPIETCAELREQVDELVCLVEPEPFLAVGVWYRDFSAVSDDEVRKLLQRPSAADARSP